MEMLKIAMPRLGVNDDYVTLTEWLVKNGQGVCKGQKIALIETSKETSEITASADGIIHLAVSEGTEVGVGQDVAFISDSNEAVADIITDTSDADNLRITDKARKLIEQYDIDISLLPKDQLIKEKDILNLIKKPYEIQDIDTNAILVYGAGGTGKEVIDYLKETHAYEILGLIDRQYPDLKEVLGVPVVGNIEDLDRLYAAGITKIVNAVAFQNRVHYRKEIFELLQRKGFEFVNIIHKTASIEPSVKMGVGNIICAGTIISSGARIGNNCLINNGSIISHDCIVSDHCHIASGAVLAGYVTIGENTLIGQNCTLNIGVKIGKNVVIQNGVHVFKDVKDDEVVFLK